ncbi:serine/threonine protein kinase [Caballeronia arationis]|uniref:Stress response kinase A n=1 Tax=Caballeronia arationis TaxID=1777142 RepID=A0A7Z7IBS1_9BURK|nr:serine/threonine protein kinase [Caballeronia arationis]SAK88856.1 serine/threonine protein kinase [Caballeronia arationis]SOE82980.1 Ser/Thr protein kinase RdoA involved in Cpx stress response, MazF antagonist [Caballeronia arationis]
MNHDQSEAPGASSPGDAQSTQAVPPFAGLTPECVLDALDSVLLPAGERTDGRMLPLNSYENRVYQVGMEDGPPVVAKFYRPNRWSDDAILEEHAFVAELARREIPAVPARMLNGASLHHFDGFRFSIFERRGGRAPDIDGRNSSETLEWLGRFIGRIHAVGAIETYRERPILDIQSFGFEPRDFLLTHDFIPRDVREAYESVVRMALEGVERCFERAGEIRAIRLHGDCHPSNVLWTDAGPHFVDFDDSRMGPAVQDLWLLLPGERAEASRALADLLAGYEDFCDFEPRELHLVEALRTLRLIHYSAWLARRWDDPAFPAAFPWFNTQRYWEDRILELREQVAAMDEGPLWPV